MVVARITFHPSAQPSTMAASFHFFDGVLVRGRELKTRTGDLITYGRVRSPTTRQTHHGYRVSCCSTNSLSLEAAVSRNEVFDVARAVKLEVPARLETLSDMTNTLLLADLDPATAKLAMSILGPFLSAFAFLFILRIVMSWYPKLPVGKFPYVLAYAPTEPLLIPTRKLIPPLAGVDVTPVVWFGIVSFLNEILVGPQGLLVLVSQQVS